MIQDTLQTIQGLAEEFFQKAGFDAHVNVCTEEGGAVLVRATTEDPQILIGHNGKTLSDIQHLLKALTRKQIHQQFFLQCDINDYRERKEHYLRELAKEVAQEVVLAHKEKTLDPMPSYERRIVHMELAGRADITTKSIGEGIERQIVITPKEIATA